MSEGSTTEVIHGTLPYQFTYEFSTCGPNCYADTSSFSAPPPLAECYKAYPTLACVDMARAHRAVCTFTRVVSLLAAILAAGSNGD